ncbi:MAG: TIGR03089 family protein [Nocardioidaceae bacterium]
MPAPSTTFPALLDGALRADPSRPLVTFYDDATGERVELSVATYANWVAKTAGLCQDELDVERGALVLVELPTHWLGAVWLGAAWSLGARVSDDPALATRADLVVCGPDRVAAHAPRAADVPVVALSLRPLGGRFTDPLPAGVVDYGAVALAQPDAFVAYDAPTGDDVAWDADGATQAELLSAAAGDDVVDPHGRLLTDLNPCTRQGLRTLLAPLARDGGTIWVRHPDQAAWERRAEAERATARLRA